MYTRAQLTKQTDLLIFEVRENKDSLTLQKGQLDFERVKVADLFVSLICKFLIVNK